MPDSTNNEIVRLNDSIERLTATVDRLELMLRGTETDPDKSIIGRLAAMEIKVNAVTWVASSALIAALGAVAAKFIK